ncbi:MAG: CmpA/NrtA family ABC transporter substrate-binding protein [Pseudomonadota bacterium]
MKLQEIQIGFIPLVDAAPLIAASEMGFAEEEGLYLTLSRSPSWSTLRDKLCFGQLDAAHMLAPMPIAGALGLGGVTTPLHALSVLSVNGNVIGVSREIGARMRAAGHDFAFDNAETAGRALIGAIKDTLRIGVPFPFSMHAELVHYWLTALGVNDAHNISIQTVPPPMMPDALKAGEIDAFCVGEPWGSSSVETGVADLLLPCSAIWAFAPEKVLAVRAGWADENRDTAHRLIRAVWRASRWLSEPSSLGLATELLSRTPYLDLAPEVVECALLGRFAISSRGDVRTTAGFVDFFNGAAGFPWRSQAEWIGRQMASRLGLDHARAAKAAQATFRSDIYRAALGHVAHDLPSASAKVEGSVTEPLAVGSIGGRLILPRDAFFDGRIFEPTPA